MAQVSNKTPAEVRRAERPASTPTEWHPFDNLRREIDHRIAGQIAGAAPPALGFLITRSRAITRSLDLIPQRLPCLQRVLNPLLRLLFAAKRLEGLALQVEQVLFADQSAGVNVAAAEDFCDLGCDFDLMIADEFALAHDVYAHF